MTNTTPVTPPPAAYVPREGDRVRARRYVQPTLSPGEPDRVFKQEWTGTVLPQGDGMLTDDGSYLCFDYVFLGRNPSGGINGYAVTEVEPLPLPPAAVAVADGETRQVTKTWPDGSYACPFCESPVVAGAARTDWDQGCPNPACRVNMAAEQLAGARQRDAEQQADDDRRRRISESIARATAEDRQREAELWAEVSAEAEKRGACLECLRKSYWRSGQPKFVRHRTANYHEAG